ncbi:MAG: hypothetical protein FIB01_03750 [Gemmatimonadetes bacterium]|nr:hypothetical protein [Gemmatimonadota bacterium]
MYARVGFRSLLALLGVVALVAACGKKGDTGDQQTGSVTSETVRDTRADWPAGAAVQLDSGNAAFSAKQYAEALRHYQAILDMQGTPKNLQVTAYFGQYMTYSAQGDTVNMNAAAARMQELEPGASLLGHGNPMMMDSTRPAPQAPNDSIHGRRSP